MSDLFWITFHYHCQKYICSMYIHTQAHSKGDKSASQPAVSIYTLWEANLLLVYQLIYMYYGSMSSCANMNGGFVALRCQWTYCFVHWATNILHIVLLLVTETFFFLVKLSKKEILWIFTGIWTGNMTPGCYPVPVITIRNYRNLSNDTMSLHV